MEKILLIPNQIKNTIIKKVREKDHLLNIKFMSPDEFAKKLTFDYDEKTIYHLMKKYNIKYDIALIYLKNLYHLSDKLKNDKMAKLQEIKEYLLANNLLITDEYFQEFIKNKEIYIYGYDYLNKYYHSILEGLNYHFINTTLPQYEIKDVYCADTREDEVIFIANQISSLIQKGISISNIKIIAPPEYESNLRRIFSIYNLPLEQNYASIYSIPLVKELLNNLENPTDILNTIKTKDLNLYNQIMSILNKYAFASNKEEVQELIKIAFQNTHLSNNRSGIAIISLDNLIEEDDYIFLLGFNKENIPIIIKDEDYFNDKEKEILGIDTSTILNIENRKSTIRRLLSIKHLTISYKLYGDSKATISDLIENINIIPIQNSDYQYSHLMNQIQLAKKLDNFLKYNIKDKDLNLLYSNYSHIPYLKYDNSYKPILSDQLYKYLNGKLTLSYSTLDIYNKCKFRYYLSSILKVKENSDDFASIIGSTCHYILSCMDREGFNIDTYYEEYLNTVRNLTFREKFFLKNIKEEMKFVIDSIHKQLAYTTFNQKMYEEKVYINKESRLKITFMGVIDKVLYKVEDKVTYLVVIDYKTGNPSISIDNLEYGFNLQLPIYLYLSSNMNLQNIKIVGFYLQKILTTSLDNTKDYLTAKENNLKLEGYSLKNEQILSKFDTTYQDSKLIKSMKLTKEGFSHYSKVLSEEEIKEIITKVEEIINKSIIQIENADFTIDPKVLDGENISCKYCEYQSICYRRAKDITYINTMSKEEENEISK